MKSVIFISFIFICCILFKTVLGLRCWECLNARSNNECLQKGRLSTCHGSNMTCEDHIRHEKHGDYMTFEKRCKQTLACMNNLDQNFRDSNPVQCNIKLPSSVCRCCCFEDECNKDMDTCLKSMQLRMPKYGSCDKYPPRRARSDRQCSGNLLVGSSCIYKCHDGFDIKGKSAIKCLPGGKWEKAPTCVASVCKPKLFAPKFGSVECNNGNRLYSVCLFNCLKGYNLVGSQTVQCTNKRKGAVREWSSKPPICAASPKCPKIDGDKNLQKRCYGRRYPGSSCHFNCKLGYRLVGSSKLTCNHSPVDWDFPIPKCEAIRCQPSYTNFTNGLVDCTDDNRLRSSCRFACDLQFKVEGSRVIKCYVDSSNRRRGKWSSTPPICKAKPCRYIHPPLHGSMDCLPPLYINDNCNFKCDDRYQLVGQSKLTCEADGIWNYKIPHCKLLACPRITAPFLNGYKKCSDYPSIGSECVYTCNQQYELIGDSTILCVKNPFSENIEAIWTSTPPHCKLSQCLNVQEPLNGKSKCDFPLKVGSSKCQFSCQENFVIQGPSVIYCESDGSWSSNPPTCVRILCPEQTPILNGNKTCSNGRILGSNCNFSCEHGYRLSGTKKIVCIQDPKKNLVGIWDSKAPTCQEILCEPLSQPDNSKLVCSSDKLAIGSVCDVTCNEGFYLEGSKVVTCKINEETASWDKILPSCLQILCPKLPLVDFKGDSYCSDGRKYGSRCNYSCNINYRLVGSSNLHCTLNQTNDQIGSWNNNLPICEEIFCDKLTEPDHSTISCSSNDESVGSKCEVVCDEGYYLVGTSLLSCDNVENKGIWNNVLPTCKLILCPSLSSLYENGMKICNDGRRLGSSCRYDCEENYKLIGAKTINCIEDENDLSLGRWDQEEPKCEEILCPRLNLSPNSSSSCSLEPVKIGEVCEIICDSKYYMSGANLLTCENKLDEGMWDQVVPICTEIKCPPLNQTSRFESWNCSDGSSIFSNCKFSCPETHRIIGVSEINCVQNQEDLKQGVWDNPQPVCKELLCDNFSKPPHSIVKCSSKLLRIGTICSFEAERGSIRIGSNNLTCEIANDSPVWSDSLPVFDPIICEDLERYYEDGKIVCSNELMLDSICNFTCNENMRLVGSDQLTCIESSESNLIGVWDQEVPFCQDILCEPLIAPENSDLICSSDVNHIGVICQIKCDHGFYLEGKEKLFCLNQDASGVWDDNLPSCKRLICPVLEPIDNVNRNCDDEKRYVGTICRYGCKKNHRLIGNETISCVVDPFDGRKALWNYEEPICEEILCDEIKSSLHLITNCLPTSRNVGTICNFNCNNDAYQIEGADSIKCEVDKDGFWSDKVPQCVLKKCPELEAPHGNWSCTDERNLFSNCSLSCNEGYNLIEETNIVCKLPEKEDLIGKWSKPKYSCQYGEIILCKKPDLDVVMTRECENSFSPLEGVVGEVCRYRCNRGYVLHGAEQVVCNANGYWSESTPYCSSVKCEYYPRVNDLAYPICEGNNVGDKCLYKCADSMYSIKGSDELECILITNSTAKWFPNEPTCERNVCEPFKDTEIEKWECAETIFKETLNQSFVAENRYCLLTCLDDTYEYVGDRNATCQKFGEWSHKPKCRSLHCLPAISEIENGIVNCSGGNYIMGECEFTCKDNFVLSHHKIFRCQRNPNEDLEWSSEVPSCITKPCPSLEDTMRLHGTRDCTNGLQVGSQCFYKCARHHYVYPPTSNPITCQDNLRWDKPEPCCALKCPPDVYANIGIVIDASSDISRKNFKKSKQLTNDLINTISIEVEGSALFSVLTYASKNTMINLDEYQNSADFALAFKSQIKYKGSNSKMVNVFKSIITSLYKTKIVSRSNTHRILLFLTSGVVRGALPNQFMKLLHQMNPAPMILVVPIKSKRPANFKFLNDVVSINSKPKSEILTEIYDEGFESGSKTILQKIIDKFCSNPCNSYFHSSTDVHSHGEDHDEDHGEDHDEDHEEDHDED